MSEWVSMPFVTLFVTVFMAIATYFGSMNTEGNSLQLAAQAAARQYSQDPNTTDVVNAATSTLNAGGIPSTWNGQQVINPNDIQMSTSDGGKIVTAAIKINAPVIYPHLLEWLGVQGGPTQSMTRVGSYSNEWADTTSSDITQIPVSGGGTSGSGGTSSPWTVSLSSLPSDTTFLNGTSVTLTASVNQNVSLSNGDAIQILDETTGQWLGMPIYQGTTDTVTVSGANESDTYVAYVAPLGDSAGAIAQSNSETLQWESVTAFASNLTITAQSPNGTVWDYHNNQANGGKPNVFAGTPVSLTANMPNIYIPSGATFEIEDMTTGQVIDSGINTSSLTTSVSKVNSTDMYAAILSSGGQQASTDSVGHDVQVTWLNNWNVSLAESLNGANQTVSFTGTASCPLQSSTMNGPYQYWMYLYNQSLGQWEQPEPVTGNETQYTWSNIAGVQNDSFVAYVETSSSPTAGSYPSTAQAPPIESSSIKVPNYLMTIAANSPVPSGQTEPVTGQLTWGGVGVSNALVTITDSAGSPSVTGYSNGNGNYSINWTAPNTGGSSVTLMASALGVSATCSVSTGPVKVYIPDNDLSFTYDPSNNIVYAVGWQSGDFYEIYATPSGTMQVNFIPTPGFGLYGSGSGDSANISYSNGQITFLGDYDMYGNYGTFYQLTYTIATGAWSYYLVPSPSILPGQSSIYDPYANNTIYAASNKNSQWLQLG